jgi:hypothetical protein
MKIISYFFFFQLNFYLLRILFGKILAIFILWVICLMAQGIILK